LPVKVQFFQRRTADGAHRLVIQSHTPGVCRADHQRLLATPIASPVSARPSSSSAISVAHRFNPPSRWPWPPSRPGDAAKNVAGQTGPVGGGSEGHRFRCSSQRRHLLRVRRPASCRLLRQHHVLRGTIAPRRSGRDPAVGVLRSRRRARRDMEPSGAVHVRQQGRHPWTRLCIG